MEDRQSTPVDLSLLRSRLGQLISRELDCPVSLSIALVDDAEIRQVHREFLQDDTATDVISFDLSDPSDPVAPALGGELVVSVETAQREAHRQGWSLEAELLLYCVHGFLHLCGYDDTDAEPRELMRKRERELLSEFGLCPAGLQP